MKIYYLLLIILVTGCLYITPESTQISQKSINSTQDTFDNTKESTPETIQKFEFNTNYPDSHTVKGVDNYFDECDGCFDFIGAAASAMNRIDSQLSYEDIFVTSGALRLDSKDKTFERFYTTRVNNHGFTSYFASNPKTTSKLSNFFQKNNIKPNTLTGAGSIPYIKSLLYSGVLPILVLDRHYIFEEQALRYNLESNLIGEEHKQIFVTFVGYDKNFKINDPSIEGFKSRYQEIAPNNFIDSISSEFNDYGKSFIIYLIKTNFSNINIQELIEEDIKASHINLNNLKKELLVQGYATRTILANYYKDKDHAKYLKYKESSQLFKQLMENFNKDIIDKVILTEK